MVELLEGVLVLGAVCLDVYAYKKMKDAEEELEIARMHGSTEPQKSVLKEKTQPAENKNKDEHYNILGSEPTSLTSNFTSRDDFDQHVVAVNTKINSLEDEVLFLKEKAGEQGERFDEMNSKLGDLNASVKEMLSKAAQTQDIDLLQNEGKFKNWVEQRIESEYVEVDKHDQLLKKQAKRLKRLAERLSKTQKRHSGEVKERVSKKVFAKSLQALKVEIEELLKKERKTARKAKTVKTLKAELEQVARKQKKTEQKASEVKTLGVELEQLAKKQKKTGKAVAAVTQATTTKTKNKTKTRTSKAKTKTKAYTRSKPTEIVKVTTEVPKGVEASTEVVTKKAW